MEILETVGVDISKKVIDTHLHKKDLHRQFENNKKGFKQMVKWLEKNSDFPRENLMFAMEHTGIYCYNISLFLFAENFNYVILPGLEIKQSMGMTRGKNDKADAKRIALYAYEKRDRLKSHVPSSESIVKLKRLFSLRERMVKQRAGYKMSLKEQSEILSRSENKLLLKTQKILIKCLTKEIDTIEQEVESIVTEDDNLRNQYELIITIKGVGKQTALYMIVFTEGFEKFDCWRKFASYCGVAPFPNTSGSSIRGRTKVSHLANKKLKSLLDLCAKSSIQYNEEMKLYYEKRIALGKNKMSTINIVRNKILARIFAVIKRKSPYVDLMKFAA
ncbi:IS110 family transposase [Maribacter sp. ACAM166]|uniref:IS110 family transposase n=1 Tax=Maribacter sp. ACAM166 TaxID=2508996 RepID=UPI0010FF3E5F|nr:IS110 family transposase [Maribacter sp. ACAM166]TLP70121.1 IS110 family transposase [Maribacter sp. ACAM166]